MAARVSNRVIAERIDELETFIEDSLTEAVSANASWKDPLTLTLALGDGEDEYSVDQIREAARNCYEAYHANALIRRAVNVKSHFVWGRGVTITSDQVEVNAVLTDWLERNQGELGHLGRVEKEIQAQIVGNLFLLCQVDELGAVEVVTVPISEIAGYLRDPKNPRKVWYWKRTFTEYTVQKDGTSTGKSQTYWYPALGHNPEKQPKTIGGTPVVWTDRLYHAPLPRAGKGVYGLPAIVAGIPWGKAYTQHLSNVASINAALATFAWKATGANPAAARAVADIVDRQKRTPIPAGSTLASTPGVTMEPIRTAGVATSADEARRFALMVCSDTDVPEHILLGDPSTGNLATTKTMERPLELAVLDRQAWWVDTLTLLGSFAVEARVLAQGFAPLTGKVEFDDWGRRQVLVSVRRVVKDHETDREVTEARAAKAAPGTKATKKEAADANLGPVREEVAEVTVEFPAILEHDPVSEVAAIISAATAGTGSLAGIMDRATFQRLLLRALNIPNVDDAIAEMDDEDIARQVERHENPPELELARQAQAAKLGGEEPDEDDEDAPPAKKGAKKPTKRSRDKDVEEGIEESLSAVATALQEVARTALVEAEGDAEGHWVTLRDGRRIFIRDTIAVPKGLANATTIEEINAWYKVNYPDLHFDMTGIDPETAKRVAIKYNELATKYYDVTDHTLKGFYVTDRGFNSHAGFDGENITLSEYSFSNPESLQAHLIEDEAVGWHPKGVTEIESVIVHEYGHLVSVTVGDALDETMGYEASAERRFAWRSLPGPGLISAYCQEYGATDETFAEAFVVNNYPTQATQYMHPIAVEQRRMINDALRGRGKRPVRRWTE